MLKTLCVFGTRPEAIKMAPVIKKLQMNPFFENKICVTGQHEQLLEPFLKIFDLKPHYNLKVMSDNQDLSSLTSKVLCGLSELFKKDLPELILVHGDTTTTFAATLAAYYHKIPVAHVEAGLRTQNIYSPWPEEANRKLTGTLARLHFAPTSQAQQNLLKEGVPGKSIHITGNTVIDALFEINHLLDTNEESNLAYQKKFSFLQNYQRMILVTGHRRESFGQGFESICMAIKHIAESYDDVAVVYPVHLNPNVQAPVYSLLSNMSNVFLIPPVDYLEFVYLMKKSYFILTDSGGVQEEAPSLGKPVLVMRDTTERTEAITAGTAKLIGTNSIQLIEGMIELLDNTVVYEKMSIAPNPYGDGKASDYIEAIIMNEYSNSKALSYQFKMESAE